VGAHVVTPRSFDVEPKGKSGIAHLHEVTDLAAKGPVRMVQSTLAQLARERTRFGQRFYENFFAVAPDRKALFVNTPPELQDRMFVEILFLVARSLPRMDELLPALAELGARHVAYGAVEADFASVKRALMATLHEMLGDAMTLEAEAAWSRTYDTMAGSMVRGMQVERARAGKRS